MKASPQPSLDQAVQTLAPRKTEWMLKTGRPKKMLGFGSGQNGRGFQGVWRQADEKNETKEDKALRAEFVGAVSNTITDYDYDGVILSLVKRYCPTGMLGLALTALLASFMSGMAGNVTAFNTVWTYDLYQAYIAETRATSTISGWDGNHGGGHPAQYRLRVLRSEYNNAMDIIQLVFGFVNAPLFATFLLGMFWARCTGTGAFVGLFGGIASSAVFHAVTIAAGNTPGVKGGYIEVVQTFPSEMAQNFWLATFAFLICLVLTLSISLMTARTKSDKDLEGLVYSLTPKLKDEHEAWYLRPSVVGVLLLVCCVLLNVIFR